ncbi:MAG TPA: acylphosphatase [archaeon]|nr:acylphosphatase [archaeon]
MGKVRIHVFASGIVQGINFRYYAKMSADKLGVKGWIRNLPDRRVEVVSEGNEKDVNEFVEFLKKGPERAKVLNLEIKKEEYKGEFNSFEIIH